MTTISFLDPWLTDLDARGRDGVVVAAGGASDIILAHCIAMRAVEWGARRVDIVQPLGCASLTAKGIGGPGMAEYGLESLPGTDPELVLRHFTSIPNGDLPMKERGKGIRLSLALASDVGERLVCAGLGDGPRAVAARPWMVGLPYEFAIAVDGGGDILTHDEREFDRIVVGSLRDAWGERGSMGLIAMGLGADGGSHPDEFVGACPPGWRHQATAAIEPVFADCMQAGLERGDCWHSEPRLWSATEPRWDYGLKVPQIIAMAIRDDFPFPCDEPGCVSFPRRKKLTVMDPDLLRQARYYRTAAHDQVVAPVSGARGG